MKKTGLVVVFLLLILGCQMAPNRPSIYDFIPENSNLVIEINNFERLKSALRNNEILSKSPLTSILEKRLGTLDSLKFLGTLLICAHKENNVQNFTFISEQNNIRPNNYFEANQVIKDSIWIVSDQANLISKKFNTLHSFVKYRELADANSTLSLFNVSNRNFDWGDVFLNIHASPESLTANGIILEKRPHSQSSILVQNNASKSQEISKVAPENFISMESYNISDFKGLFSTLKAQDSTMVVTNLTHSFFGTINEMGLIKTKEGQGFVGRSIDLDATKSTLIGYQSVIENYRSVPIYEFNNPDLLPKALSSIAPNQSPNKYTILENFIIFSDKEDFLKGIISSYQNKNTLEYNESYRSLKLELSNDVSFEKTIDSKSLSVLLNSLMKTDFTPADLKTYNHTTYQLIKDDQILHINARMQKDKPMQRTKKIKEEFSLVLDTDILGEIQFVDNHLNAQKDIVVQDVENQLYLISNLGVVQWKKKLPGPIMGPIQQVDLYRNGRLQLIFSTSKHVHVIDRLGRDVGSFPLKFKDDITQPLAIFDYDNNKDYRFLVTQKNKLLMYDVLGQRVKGFKYNSQFYIGNTPKHFRHQGKDYIVFKADDKLQILNRRGQVRISVEESIDFSNQDLYFYKNQWTTLDKKGDLVQIDTRGRVSRQSLGFSPKTELTTSSKTLVALWDNYLQIKDQKIVLAFGQKTPPKLFNLNDTIYIAVTDLESNTIWFYDSQGHALAGFPVYATSTIDLENADTDKALEFVGQSSPSSIIMYQLY